MKRKPLWSQRDLAILKRMYVSGESSDAIARELNRTLSAIRGRAQIEGYRRPKRFGLTQIAALRKQAKEVGLAIENFSVPPTAIRIAILLAKQGIADKHSFDAACEVGPSARNNALAALRDAGLILCDEYYSPVEVILTRKAFAGGSVPGIVAMDAVRANRLPTTDELYTHLDGWISESRRALGLQEKYRDFIKRQFLNAQSGDIEVPAFYSIFVETS